MSTRTLTSLTNKLIDTTLNPRNTMSFDINSLRVGKITKWEPDYVTCRVYNDTNGRYEELRYPKSITAIIENPFYAVMNERSSTVSRLLYKLRLLDIVDEQTSSGKLDLIIQLPYVIRNQGRKDQAESRRKELERQLAESKYGVAYTDGTEKINSYSDSIESMVAALVGMIPEGLYLLTSVALAASVLRLTQKKVLVRDLNCVETLARIDTLCVDKTGTITEPGMHVEKLEMLKENMPEEEMKQLLGSFAGAFQTPNDTLKALQEFSRPRPYDVTGETIPFNSTVKYSACQLNGRWYVLGAPQFIAGMHYREVAPKVQQYAREGFRVLLAGTGRQVKEGERVEDLEPLCLIVIRNNVRKSAPETFAYFKKQGVNVKVISGDDPETVSRIAASVNIEGAENYVDSSTLKNDDAIAEAVEKYTVFGRTTPEQKKKMVLALQAKKHHVAMTGDGVNDVLALKEADCGIAMASGSDAASQIAQLVLLDSDFAAVPDIVLEGRRVINNIERSAMLFLSKNIFSIGLSVLCVLLSLSYPLQPLQLSFISSLTIGIPGFFLAMQPNDGRITGRFLPNVLYRAFPGGITELLVVGGLIFYASVFGLKNGQINTMAVYAAFAVGLLVLSQACRPWNKYRVSIFISMAVVSVFTVYICFDLLSLHVLSMKAILILILFLLLVLPVMRFVLWCILWLNRGYNAVKRKFRRA